MDLREFFGCSAVIVGGLFLLQLESIALRKIGLGLLWLASGLGVYFFTGSAPLTGLALLAWILFPVWNMVFLLRRLRVPRHRELTDARAPRDNFEELAELSRRLEEAGFEVLDECRLRPSQHEQYYRIFTRADGLVQATIGYLAQAALGFHFVAFTSSSRDGRRWLTWDYPLTYILVMPPDTAVYRALHCETVEDLFQAHRDFLKANDLHDADLVPGERTREAARAHLEETLNQQIEYNISRGFLAPAKGADAEDFCYSWRGTLHVAGRILRDVLF